MVKLQPLNKMIERITRKCYLQLIDKQDYIKNELLPEIRKRIQEARKNGDFSENAELQYELKTKAEYEKKLGHISYIINTSEIIDINDIEDKEIIQFGARIHLSNVSGEQEEDFYCSIVSKYEVDISDSKNLYIYYKAPMAQNIMGKNKNDIVLFRNKKYKIVSISYANIIS